MFEVAASSVVRVAAVARSGFAGELVARASAMPPGPESMRLLDAVDVELLDDVERVDHLVAWERAGRWVSAKQQEAIVAVAGRSARDADDFAREHVRVALADSGGSPRADVDVARRLAGPLHEAKGALEKGRISFAHARVLARETQDLADADAAEVVAQTLPKAERRTPAEFRRIVRHAVVRADPVLAEHKAFEVLESRTVEKRIDTDGRATLFLEGPALAIASMWTAIDALADRRVEGDTRNRDQRRFDAAAEVLAEALSRPDVPLRRGARPVVNVYADLPTWADLADNPVEVAGFGVVTAGAAREAFSSSRWRVMITDTVTGMVRGLSDETYRPSARTNRLLEAQDRGCVFPGCHNPVHRCDADHGTPHAEGGCTDPENCGLVCRRHHRMKTFTRWRWRRTDTGRIEWRDPAGRCWPREPTRYLIPQPVPA